MIARALIVIGAGGHGRVVADAAQMAGFSVIGFADDGRAGQEVFGIRTVPFEPAAVAALAQAEGAQVVVAIGDNRSRESVQQQLNEAKVQLATVVHPRAVISKHAWLGPGAVVLAQAQVGVAVRIGAGAIVNHGASVDHDSSVGDFAHLSPGVHMGGEVTVGRGTHLAVGVSVRNRVCIGEWSVVGVGAAVVGDLPNGVVAIGVPAEIVRSVGSRDAMER